MSQKVNIVLVDDIDGTEADETVSFALDGTAYEIDLNDAHAGALRESLASYVGYGRKVAGRRTSARKSTAGSNGSGPSAAEVREWARSNGFTVPDRGRIPGEVREAFDAAN